jgi:hypothetical protein
MLETVGPNLLDSANFEKWCANSRGQRTMRCVVVGDNRVSEKGMATILRNDERSRGCEGGRGFCIAVQMTVKSP